MERFQQKRSYGRDKQQHHQSSTKVRNYSDPAGNVIYTHRPSSTGNSQIRRHVDALDAVSDTGSCSSGLSEDDSFGFELRQASTKRSSGPRIKKLLAEELTKAKDSRRRSPSVIARLMGLDVPPPEQPTQKQEKKFSESYQRRTASIGFVEENSSHDARSFRTNKRETREFKDVYEVFETSQAVKHGNSAGPKETTSSKVSEAKMEYIRQKFMDVKRLSTEEKLQHSKEFHDALDVLDSNKEVLLKFLEEPDFLFTRHLHDLQGVPPPPPSGHITVLKSSNKYEKWKLEREQCRNDTSYCRKSLQDGGISHLPNKHNVHTSSKVSKVRPEKRNEASLLPTRIVVLKPNVGTLQKPSQLVSFPNSLEDLESANGKHRSYENRGAELRDRRLSSREVEVLKHKAHGSREIAKEITRQMRNSVRSSSSTKVVSSGPVGYGRDYSSCTSSVSADDSDARNAKSKYSSSKSYSTESSVSREAKKRISERLKMTNGSQKVRRPSRSNTLGEMLAMPDRETRPANQEDNSDRLALNDGVAKWGTPLGISSRDGWKDEYARSLPRSRSLPSSSTVLSPRKVIRDGAFGSDRSSFLKEAINRGSNQSRRPEYDQREGFFTKSSTRYGRRSNSFSHAVLEYVPSLQEAHLKPDELRISEKNDLLENTSIAPQSDGDPDVTSVTSPITIEITRDMPEDAEMCCDQERKDVEMCYESLVTPEPTTSTSSLKYGNSVETDPDAPVHEKFSTEEAPKESLRSTTYPVTESESPRSCKEAEQPSPVSILEPVFVDEASPDSDCFGSVSADLQGLRMQLQLLKLESTEDAYSEDIEMPVSSDDETGKGSVCFSNEKGDLIERLSDKNSRDFSYLIDVLVDSEFLDADTDMQLTTWYAPDCPLNLSVFENLEKKKYGGDATEWPRSERRLLFDKINSGLIEILQQHEDPHPWIKATRKIGRGLRKEPLEEELWKLLLVSEREEESAENVMVLGKDLRWLELGDEIDVVGREIERSLMDELVAEILPSM